MAPPRPADRTRQQWLDDLYDTHPLDFDDELVAYRASLAANGYPNSADQATRDAAIEAARDDMRAERFRQIRGDRGTPLRDLILIVLLRNSPRWQALIARRGVE